MPIRWIGDVLPKIMEQDAGSGYCYAWHAETSGTDEKRPELNSSPAPAFSEAAGVVSSVRIERGPSNSLYFSLGEWPRLPFTRASSDALQYLLLPSSLVISSGMGAD